MPSNSLYVYGVAEDGAFDGASLDLAVSGVEEAEEVRTVSVRSLAAVVSDVEMPEPAETEANLTAHDEVLRAVLERDEEPTVVPMRFGMVFESARTLKNVMRGARPAFRQALRDVDGTIELGVKVVSEQGADIDRESAREIVDDHLATVHAGHVSNDLFSDRLLVNDAYLVERDDREALDEAVGDLKDALGGEASVQYTGPWAPYNFVDIEVGARH